MAQALAPSGKPMKAAFSNAGLQATWCAQGKRAAEFWGKLFNVEVTWFDSAREGGVFVSDDVTGENPQKPATPGKDGVLGDADRNVASAV